VGIDVGGVWVGGGVGLIIVHSFDPEVRERVQAKEIAISVVTISQNLKGRISERCIGSYSILKTIHLAISVMQD
jgi:hypothetical protein